MGIELARAYVTVGVNSSGVGRSLSQVESEAKSLSDRFGEVKSWTDQYSDSLLKLNSHLVAGRITQQVYNRALQELENSSPAIIAAQRAAARAADEHAEMMRRGRAVTDSMQTASQRYGNELGNLQGLLASGAITQEIFNKAVRKLDVDSLRNVSSQLSEIGGTAVIMGSLVTATFGASAHSAVMAAGKFEQTMIAFSTMMGSVEKAGGLLSDLTRFAAETPFEMPEIEQVARGMVMFGEDSKTLMDTLKMLGNAASGTSSSFGMLGLVYNQIRGVGKLLTQDFRQLSTRGVISLRDIAKYYKVTDAAAQEMISRGKVSFEDFRKIMLGLTTESGRFANMMEKQSESMLGLLSTFSDAWRITMRQIGEEIVPVAKWFVKIGIVGVEAFSGLDSVTKKLIAGTLGLGTVLGGVFTTMAGGAFAAGKLISVYTSTTEILSRYAEVSRAAALAQGSLNVAAAATPYVLAAVAAALAAMMGYKFGQWMADQIPSVKAFNAELKRQRDELEAMKAVGGWSFKGVSEQDVREYANATESRLAGAKMRLKEMEEKWFGNKEAIQLTRDQIALLQDQLDKANEKLTGFAESQGLPGLDKMLKDTETELGMLDTEIAGVLQRIDEAKGPRDNVMVYDVAEEKRRAENLAMYEEKLLVLRAKQDAATKRSIELRDRKIEMEAEVDDKATTKIKEKTEALKIANATYGMSAIQAEVYKMRADKVSEAEIKANAAELERAESLKRLTAEKERATKAEQDYANALLQQLQQPTLLPADVPDPFSGLGESMLPDMWADFDELGQILEEIKTPAERLDDAFARLKHNFDDGLLSAENYRKSLDMMGRSLTESVMTPSERMNRQFAEWKQMLDNGAISQETYNRLIKQMGQSATESVNPQEALKSKVAELDALLKAGAISQETYDKLLKQMGQSVRDSIDPKESLNRKIEEYDALLKAGVITQQEYNKAVWEAKRANDAFGMSSGFLEFGQRIQEAIMRAGPGEIVGKGQTAPAAPAAPAAPVAPAAPAAPAAPMAPAAPAAPMAPAAPVADLRTPYEKEMARRRELYASTRRQPAESIGPDFGAGSFEDLWGKFENEQRVAMRAKTRAIMAGAGDDYPTPYQFPSLEDASQKFELSQEGVVAAIQEGNKKTDEVVKAIKNQPKGGLL